MATNGLTIRRLFTKPGENPLDSVEWTTRDSRITNPDGSVVFEMKNAEIPAPWSQIAADIMVSKYFRKAGIPQFEETGVEILDESGDPVLGPERSARQVITRLAATWRSWGERYDYFATEDDAQAFEDELTFMLVNQIAAPNSPQWFNTGLHHMYGLTGPSQGFWYVDQDTRELRLSPDSYTRPAPHACFIQSVNDDLVNEGGIMDLWTREARLFKFGSGCTSGDSRIYVAGEGFIPIRSLFERFHAAGRPVIEFDGKGRYIDLRADEVVTLSANERTGEYQQDRVERVWQYEVHADDKVVVRFDRGTKVTVSAWHPFLAWDGDRIVERRADKLTRGDAVLGPNETALAALPEQQTFVSYQTRHFKRDENHAVGIDPEIAWLCGYFLGDGSLGRIKHSTTNRQGRSYSYDRLRLRFHDETVEVLEKVQRIIERTFDERAAIQNDGRGSNGKHLAYTGRRVTGFFAELFGVGPKTYSLTMPAFVWDSGREVGLAFLAGLVDSDGWVSDGRAWYATASPGFARDVAVLASLYRLGGGVVEDRTVAKVTIVHRSAGEPARTAIGRHLVHPERRRRLLEYGASHERKYCMSLSDHLSDRIFPAPTKKADWLKYPIADETFHLGRLHYEGLVNPTKLGRAVDLLDADDEVENVARIARSLAFVTSVEPCTDDPDFYDLTVENHSNYLAGETGLVAIHNTGTNFSNLRGEGEPLSGGGKSSGMMSFLKIGDRAAGAIKSGGTTRRAAKMVILDVDHPDIEEFIAWKKVEEDKVRALIAAGYPSDFNGEAYQTVSGQNSNNSVRVSEEFLRAVENDENWELTARTTGEVMKTVKARDLWRQIAEAAWACADPGVQYDTTINQWHTSPAGGRIKASNPCAEYQFLDNTACNLASLNLVKFYDDDAQTFDIEAYKHAVRLWTVVLEISVTMAHFPAKEIAQGSFDYRTLGLGYANLGSLLMRCGIPYDSDEGRALTGALTAILTGDCYSTSAEMASVLGPFPRFDENRDAMLRVMRNHRLAAHSAQDAEYDGVTHSVMSIDPELCPTPLLEAAQASWDRAVEMGEQHGYRNAQASCTAPTGTIGLLMDCDTTGVEPDFALVKFKKLAGGGYFKIANQSIGPALRALGYPEAQRSEIVEYVVGAMSLEGAPHINRDSLVERGLKTDEIDNIEATLPGVFDLCHAFNAFVVGEGAMQRLGYTEDQYTAFEFDLLGELGFSRDEIEEANRAICGMQTIEGAPHLADEHLAVFDTANRNGRHGERFIHHTGHIKAMAAAQPFISGAQSKTINMPNEVTVEDIEKAYRMSARLGLKAVALYRDGSKASQPLSTTTDGDTTEEEPEELTAALDAEARMATGLFEPGISPTQAYQGISRPRFLLPTRRTGFTQEAKVGGHKIFLRTGEYEDGTLGEVFIDLAKEGATLRGILGCLAIAVSKGLQYGVPLEEFVESFTFQTFEPRGMVEGHPNIKMANSIVDYVFRALGLEYLGRSDLVQVPPQEVGQLPEPPTGIAVDAGIQLDLTEDMPVVTASSSHPAAGHPDRAPSGNGSRSRPSSAKAKVTVATVKAGSGDLQTASVQHALGEMMGDAPLCDACGHITVRNGSCYHCLNCGASMGCS